MKRKLPQYVRVGQTALVLSKDRKTYHRIAGAWDAHFIRRNGVLVVHEPDDLSFQYLHGRRLIATTKKYHDKSNQGYI